MVFRLPIDKVLRLHFLLAKMLVAKKVLLKEMQSLLGLLVFASKVIPMGHVFSCRLYMSTMGLTSPFSHIRLTKSLKDDLSIWLDFFNSF